MDFFNGQEISIGTLLAMLIYILAKEGIFKKFMIMIKIGGSEASQETKEFKKAVIKNGNPGPLGGPCEKHAEALGRIEMQIEAIKELRAMECEKNKKEAENNRDDHRLIFSKIEELWRSRRK